MKPFFKFCVLLLLVFMLLILNISVYAAEYADTLRVGIYYGSGAVNSLTLESSSGFYVGIVDGRSFTPVEKISLTAVLAEPDTLNTAVAYHVKYSVHTTPSEAFAASEALNRQGADSFVGYINSSYAVLGGLFSNNNDALWEAQNGIAAGTPISVSSNAVRLKSSADGKTVFLVDDFSKGLGVYNIDYTDTDALLTISGSAKGSYRGGFECRRSSSGESLTVVNVVSTEAYLYSVVCREMSPSWNVEALKAQAVCARNFALGRINYHSSYGFDVCRTVCCQAYSSEADNSANVHTAVDETRGELLFCGDSLVQAVYSSSMGAYTESVENVWGTPFSYLVSVENSYEDTENIYNGKWTKTLTKSRATEIMQAKGYNIGDVTEIRVLEYTPAGSVLKLLVQGTNGSKTFERESCRSIFNEVTYSQKYTVTAGGQAAKPSISACDGVKTASLSLGSVTVLDGSKSLKTVSDGCTAYNGKSKKQYTALKASGSSDTYTFSGEGWGHGVGMSQYGAKGMAEAGFDYEKILTHYYTGTYLKKSY